MTWLFCFSGQARRFAAAFVCIALTLIVASAQMPPGASDRPDADATAAPSLAPPPLSPPGWTAGPALPSPVTRGVGVYFPLNGKFYLMGGRTSDSAGSDLTHPLEYNPYTNAWATKAATYPDNQVNNMACGVVTLSGAYRIVCVGGSAAGSVTATARVLSYDPVGDSIAALAAGSNWPGNTGGTILPGGFAVFDNRLYIIGGFDINVGMTNQTWYFDNGAWAQGANYPVARGYIPATTIGGFIYTGGGSDYVSGLVTDTADSYKYDIAANSWSAIANIPRIVGETRALTINGRMWVMGGGRTAPNPSNAVNVYNPATNSWSLALPFSTPRRNFAVDSNGTLSGLFMAGGYASDNSVISSMEMFNSASPTITFTAAPIGAGSPGYPSTSGNIPGSRVSRADPASSCTTAKVFPGTFGTGPYKFDAYRIKNVSSLSECVTVTLSTLCSSTAFVQASAYLNSFDPANVATNWIADLGASPLNHKSFSFNLAAGQTAVLVVSESFVGGNCASYTVAVNGATLKVPYDTTHDLITDRTIYRPGSGAFWYTASSSGGSTATPWGTTGDIDVMGDYDGDGKADPAIFRPAAAGTWYILQSSTGTVRTVGWGTTNDIPLTGDIDGDGKDDFVIYRPSAGAWYIQFSSGGTTAFGWGTSTDIPLVEDFDGDGKADIVAYRPSSGTWYVAFATGGVTSFGWGTAGDIPVLGNWDGDAKADAAIFRPSAGQWYVRRSGGGTQVMAWGGSGDVPLSGDQDGDGASDFIIYRNGTWFTQFSSGGSAVAVWGIGGDKPVGRVPGS